MAPTYSTKDIDTRTQRERVRMFPGRFLGDFPLTTAAREIIDNSGDEVGRGFADHIHIIFRSDGSVEVCDNGRGLPVDFDSEMFTETGCRGANGIVKTLGTLGAGGNYSKDATSGKITAGVHGEGGAATNALSRRFDVTVYQGGKLYHQRFHEGLPGHYAGDSFDPDAAFTVKEGEKLTGTKAPKSSAPIPGSASGTSVRFLLDRALVPDAELDIDGIILRARIAAMLRPGMKLTVTRTDASGDPAVSEFAGPDYGAAAVMSSLSGGTVTSALGVSANFEFTRSGAKIPATVELAAAPSPDPTGTAPVVSVMNTVWTPDGGSYQDSVIAAVGGGLASRQIRGLDRQTGEPYPSAEDFAAVSALTVHVSLAAAAKFTSQDKSKVAGERAMNTALADAVKRQVTMWAASPANSKTLTEWANAALAHARTRQKIMAAKAASAPASKSASRGSTLALPDKYLPCLNTGRGSGAELHLCEGLSALGTIKAARDARFQAAYPLRGKTINTHGKSLAKCRKNAEFRDIEAILGCGVRENCDPSKCRFDRIFFTTDADVDGYNISSSLLDMFIENFLPLIEAGMVFIAMPPLFIVSDQKGDNRRFCVDEEERDRTVAADLLGHGIPLLDYTGDGSAADIAIFLDGIDNAMIVAEAVDSVLDEVPTSKKPDVQRCKGLGEMSADDFSETVMDPKTRTVFAVTYDPEDEADTFEIVFGNSAAARRDWIRELADNADVDVVL